MRRALDLAAILAALLLSRASAGAQTPSIQEVVLRTKPAVVLVIAEIATEVTLDCGTSGQTRVQAPVLRETGTGWFVAPSGWVITNAHIAAPGHAPSDET